MKPEELPQGFVRANEMAPDKTIWHPKPAEAYEQAKRRRPVVEPMEIRSLRDALELFRVRFPCRKLRDVKLDRVRIGAVFVKDASNKKYLVLFKRDPYFRFSKHFPHVPIKGYGMIANLKLVYWCALEGIRMAAILKDKRCYWIDGMEFYRFYEEHNTECKHITDSTEIATPLAMWKRLF